MAIHLERKTTARIHHPVHPAQPTEENMPYATFKLNRKLHKLSGATFEIVASGVQTVLCDYVFTGQNTVKGVYREYFANPATGEKVRVTYHP